MYCITLDPGKGGYNTGIIFGNLLEKEINLNIALKCREELLRHNLAVEMTREDDSYVGYSQRINKANSSRAKVFVSIHCNTGESSLAEFVYSIDSERGLKLATCIGEEIKKQGQKAFKYYNHMGNGRLDFNTVIRETKIESVIVKCGFLDNDYDRSLINTLEKQNEFGIAIARGILKYLGIEYMKE